jgi:hypothetical protein
MQRLFAATVFCFVGMLAAQQSALGLTSLVAAMPPRCTPFS